MFRSFTFYEEMQAATHILIEEGIIMSLSLILSRLTHQPYH